MFKCYVSEFTGRCVDRVNIKRIVQLSVLGRFAIKFLVDGYERKVQNQ